MADMVVSEDAETHEWWTTLPADPDLERDFGYELVDLEVVDVPTNDQTMFIPRDDDMLRDEAFVVVADRVVCDVLEYR